MFRLFGYKCMQVQMYARDKGGSYLRLYLLVGLEESGSWQLFKNPYNSLALLKFGNRSPLKHNCHAKGHLKWSHKRIMNLDLCLTSKWLVQLGVWMNTWLNEFFIGEICLFFRNRFLFAKVITSFPSLEWFFYDSVCTKAISSAEICPLVWIFVFFCLFFSEVFTNIWKNARDLFDASGPTKSDETFSKIWFFGA